MSNYNTTNPSYKREASWIFACPHCYPARVMNIATIIPQIHNSSSVITYHCGRCDFQKEVTMDD